MAGVSLALKNRVALITGGSRGIGAEAVRLFVEAGARVAFNYRQARQQAEDLAAVCGGPERCVALEQDLSSPADGRALVAAAVRAFGRLDVLVANHGIWQAEDAPIARMAEAQWRRWICKATTTVSRGHHQLPTLPPDTSCSSAPPPGSVARPTTPTMP